MSSKMANDEQIGLLVVVRSSEMAGEELIIAGWRQHGARRWLLAKSRAWLSGCKKQLRDCQLITENSWLDVKGAQRWLDRKRMASCTLQEAQRCMVIVPLTELSATFGGFIKGILRGVRCTESLRVLFLHRRPPSWTTLVLYSRAVFIFNEPAF